MQSKKYRGKSFHLLNGQKIKTSDNMHDGNAGGISTVIIAGKNAN